jgi:hypothetical protein
VPTELLKIVNLMILGYRGEQFAKAFWQD